MPTLKKWSASGVIDWPELTSAAAGLEAAIRDGRLQVRGPRQGPPRDHLLDVPSLRAGCLTQNQQSSHILDMSTLSHISDHQDMREMRDICDMSYKSRKSPLSSQSAHSHISKLSLLSTIDDDVQEGGLAQQPGASLDLLREWQKAVARILANSEALVERMAHIESGLQDVKAAVHKEKPASHADDRLLQAIKHLDDTRRHLLTQWDAYRQTLIRDEQRSSDSFSTSQGPDYLDWQRMQSRLARIEQRIEQLIEGMSR